MNPENDQKFECFDPGHSYWLEHHEGTGRQSLNFIKKEPREDGSLALVEDGVNNETVIRVLLDRIRHLNNIVPCVENEQVARCLQDALTILKTRMEERKARGVFGTNKA